MPAAGSRATHCKRGHALSEDNRYSGNGACKACARQKARIVYQVDPAKAIAAERARHKLKHGQILDSARRRVTGWEPERYHWQVMAQGLQCAICRQIPDGVLHADHDHTTGKIRSLLCGNCNTGIGMLKDDPVVLRSAANYLEQFSGG